jgi:protein-S-isoprenylcysteine O-methyltransferase Ste14
MSSLDLKLPPLAVLGFSALLMQFGKMSVPAADFPLVGQPALASALAAVGVAVATAGVIAFRRAKTTVNPLHPEGVSTLVASGVYRMTRNPMYLGMLLVLTAWALFLSNAAAFAGPAFFALYLTRFQIVPEEKILAARFGPDFASYRTQTRRWL